MLIEHMKQTFEDRMKKNPSYSLRAFARSLAMDSSTVSALLRGKRPLSFKTAKKIVDGLEIKDPVEAQALIMTTFQPKDNEADKYKELPLEIAETIAHWQHFAILALLEVKAFKSTERNIADRLNVPLTLVRESLIRMEKLELIKRDRVTWKLTGKNISTPSQIPSKMLREGHKQNILKSLESLEKDPIELRDISGITIAISRDKLDAARKLIRNFRLRMASFLEGSQQDSVYRLNIQLFPLTKEFKK